MTVEWDELVRMWMDVGRQEREGACGRPPLGRTLVASPLTASRVFGRHIALTTECTRDAASGAASRASLNPMHPGA